MAEQKEWVKREGDSVLFLNDKKNGDDDYDATGNMYKEGKEYPLKIKKQAVGENGLSARAPTHVGIVDVNGTHKRVSLWKETPKTEKHPTLKGYYEDGDTKYQFSLWEKKSKKGLIFYAGQVQFDRGTPVKKSAPPKQSSGGMNDGFSQKAQQDNSFDDLEIPF